MYFFVCLFFYPVLGILDLVLVWNQVLVPNTDL